LDTNYNCKRLPCLLHSAAADNEISNVYKIVPLITQLAFTVTLKFSIDLWLSWPTYKQRDTKC